jgi:hypothetical protein
MCLLKLREDYNLLITRFVMHFTALKIISTNVLSHTRTASHYSIILVNYLSQVSLVLLISLVSLVLPSTGISYAPKIRFFCAILHTGSPPYTLVSIVFTLTLVSFGLPLTGISCTSDTGIPCTPFLTLVSNALFTLVSLVLLTMVSLVILTVAPFHSLQ